VFDFKQAWQLVATHKTNFRISVPLILIHLGISVAKLMKGKSELQLHYTHGSFFLMPWFLAKSCQVNNSTNLLDEWSDIFFTYILKMYAYYFFAFVCNTTVSDLFEKLIIPQIVKFSAWFGTQKFFIMFARTRHWSLSGIR
jgi:hypothetical protein